MKKTLFVALIALFGGISAKAQAKPTLTKEEAHQMVIHQYPDVITDQDGSLTTDNGTPTAERHIYSTIGWVDSNGCIGYTTTWVHTIFGIEYGGVHETSTTVACP